jgi:phage baseplate assembly protein W
MALEKTKSNFLGRGWGFPPTFSKNVDQSGGTVVMVQDEEDILQSLHILFSTMTLERVMLPEYGCTLQSQVFESIDSSLFARIRHLLSDAILYYEPRIILNEIDIRQAEDDLGRIDILLDYMIRQTNTRSNMVYPFYLSEGTNVRQIGDA